MKNKASRFKDLRPRLLIFPSILCLVFLLPAAGIAQSTSQEYPTPVSTNEISGTIRARDIGDARVTSYFYTFDGSQGDMFINVVTKNFNGDIDIFNAEGLQPMTKMVIYADVAENETGRVIYLRKPERLILRVEGRTPNDDAASFKIKFAGSFVAVADTGTEQLKLPEIKAGNESGIRVNSVGTILEVIPKATPTPAETVAQIDEREESADEPTEAVKPTGEPAEKSETDEKAEAAANESDRKVEVVVTDNLPPKKEIITPRRMTARSARRRTRRPPVANDVDKPVDDKKEEVAAEAAKPADESPEKKEEPVNEAVEPAAEIKPTTRRTRTAKPKAPDPMANIRLVIMLKDGGKIERPMSEVMRFSVDRGILTIIYKNGRIGRHSMLDVAKVTIE